MINVLSILIVEDNTSDSELLIRRLKKEGFNLIWHCVDNENDYLVALDDDYDLVIADWFVPEFGGQRALQILRGRGMDIPFIIFSGTIDEETALSALRHGATDYILKDRPDRLGQAVRNAIEQKALRLEKKKNEDLLRLQSAALNAAANAIAITDNEGRIQWVNRAFNHLTGYSQVESIGMEMHRLLNSGCQKSDFYKQLWQTILSGDVWQGEMINRRKDGQLYHEEQTITPLHDDDGKISQFIAIKQDISKRKRTEADLTESKERYRALFEDSHAVLLLVDPASGEIIDANAQAAVYYGWTPDEIKQMKIYDINMMSDEEIMQEMMLAENQKRRSFHFQHRKKNGEIRDVEVFSGPLTLRGKIYLYSIVHDITERKKAEQALRENEKLIRTVIATAPIGIFVFDKNGKMTMYNAAGHDIWQGLKQVGLGGFHEYKGWWPSSGERLKSEEWGVSRALLKGETSVNEEIEIESSDLVRKMISNSAVPLLDSEGQINGAVVIAQDITERKKAEELLKNASEELKVAYDATLRGWSRALELREQETAGHSQRVVQLTLEIAQAFDMSEDELVHIRRGALLHDIGKMGIPDHILLKPGALTDDEWVIMRQHPEYAYRLLSEIPYLLPALDIPYCHHERWDGSGYPRGLIGEDIPLAARIFAVIDVWDALSCDRPYRPAWSRDTILQYIKDQSGKQFDPKVVEIFLELISTVE